jgi:hypothetical protein
VKRYFFGFLLALMSLSAFSAGDDIAAVRAKWQQMLTGGTSLEASSSLVASYLADVETRANQVWTAMIKKPSGTDNRTCIFADLPITSRDKTGSSQITLTYDRLRGLALAYKMPGNSFSGRTDVFDELISALDMMVTKHYSLAQSTTGTGTAANGGSYGNWYDWRIGTPLRYGDLLMILSDELTAEQITKYVAPILSNNTAVDNTGANKAWIAGIVAQAGVLKNDASTIAKAKTGLQSVFKYVTTGDGFYKDGSFVQHTNYAYTGGYGKALLATVAPLMYVLDGSTWNIAYSNNVEQNFYDMLFAAYEPFIYDGRFMDMVREREISRIANQDHVPGRQAIRAIVLMLDVLPAAQKSRAESMLKEWLQDEVVLQQVCSDPLEGYLEYYLPPFVIKKSQDLLANTAVEPRGKLITHKTFASMDRALHLQEEYAFGVAMTSPRIKNTEGTNDEGLRLWHIGDGMTYLYTPDKDLFANNFWATVDYQRLPGTTVVRATRGTKDGYGTFNPQTWVGGADLGTFGVAGMDFKGLGTSTTRTLEAKKSWFMFDDEIVALGSNIKQTTGTSAVETTIENRKIKSDFSNKLTVNGIEQQIDFQTPDTLVNQTLKVATVSSSATHVIPRYTLSTPVSSPAITVEYDIQLPTIKNYLGVRIYGRENEGTTDKLLNFTSIRDNYLAQRLNVSGDAQDACSPDATLTAGQWHHIKIELNMTAGTYNYYFDGKHIEQSVTGATYYVAANLVDHTFVENIGTGGVLTAIEVLTPNGGIGTLYLDNVKISTATATVYEEDFETFADGSAIATQTGWTTDQTDNRVGAGATTYALTTFSGGLSADEFAGTHTDVEWIHLEGDKGATTDVGYYFPNKATLEGKREIRNGSWDLVNIYEKYVDTTPQQNNFATFWINHGNTPADGSYAYVLLPAKSATETAAYNENPDIEILQQDGTIHAVREKNRKITAANFWATAGGTLDAYTVNKPASVMMQENGDGTIEIALSDPTRTASSVTLTIDPTVINVHEIVAKDSQVSWNASTTTLTFNTSAAAGATFHATLKAEKLTGIDPVSANDPVIATQYYNLMGQPVRADLLVSPATGVYIVKLTHASGKITTIKEIIGTLVH